MGKRRGGKTGKGKSELSIGDLVLAKVKGFPAWPAKISRPEDWDRAPDPKKYFVLFFGTQEIAFVAPADIQAFTGEVKNKLLARCQAKTVKFFSQAVKEICQAFEQLQHKDSGSLRDVNSKSDVNREAISADAEEDELECGLKDGSSTDGISRETDSRTSGDGSPGLERCAQGREEVDSRDTRSTNSYKAGEISSPLKSPKRKNKNKPPDDEANSLKQVVLALSCPKEEVCEDNQKDANVVERDIRKDNSLVKTSRSKDIDSGKKAQMNGQKMGQMTTLSKKKPKESHDVHKSGTSTVSSRTKGGSTGFNGRLDEHANDSIVKKRAAGSSARESYKELKLDVDADSEKKKELRKRRKSFQVAEGGQKDAGGNSEQLARRELSGLKKGIQLKSTMHELETSEVSYAAKTAEYADAVKDASKEILQGRKHASGRSNDIDQKAEDSHNSSDEDDLPPIKRRREASEALPNIAAKTADNRTGKIHAAKKNDELHASINKVSVTQLHAKRRAVRIYDEDDEERPKTPVHGRPASKVNASVGSSASLKKADAQGEGSVDVRTTLKNAGTVGSGPSDERTYSARVPNEHSTLNFDQPLDKKPKKVIAARSPTKPLERVIIKTNKHISGSPRKSPMAGGATNRQTPEQKKADGLLVKVSSAGNQKKVLAGPSKGPDLVTNGLGSSQSLVNGEQIKTISSGRSRNVERIATREVEDIDLVRVNLAKDISSSGGRMEASLDDSSDQFLGSKISESTMSMRNLIAAAQARRKQAHSQNNINGDASTLLTPSVDMPRRSVSPSAVQHSLPESQPDVQGHYSNTLKIPSHQDFPSDNQPDAEEFEETRVGSGHHLSAGLLTGGTEAGVARDSFEGMIETLSRTRESIGRATRLAIDCAKHGIANEVVELLIRKLESEPDDHRKIDLFFLVDSITQCSHNHKGVAGSSYIPTVQAALPRLLGAAAPRGTAAHENRRQCLKVLKLWLERKILPESLLRPYIDGMGASNDDVSTNFLLKRPSRAERAVDDPIREMEGMLVDEYGSNATFPLPGLLSSHMFEDDEDDDVPGPSYAEPDSGSPIEELLETLDSEPCTVTPSERPHCILEDVDGELEMEDVSGHPKDEQVLCDKRVVELFSEHQNSDESMQADSEEVSPYYGSPPLPPYSPPPTPPLPSSPPPPSPSSPSDPPPPPSFLSLPQSLPVPPSGPQPSFPPPMLSQQFHLPPSSIPNVSPNLSYQPPRTLENCSTPSGNQFAQMAPSTTFREHTDASVRGETNSRQLFSYKTGGINDSCEESAFSSSRPLDYGHHNLHVNSQAAQPNQHFQTRNPPFPQRPFHLVPPPLSQSGHHVYKNSPPNQRQQHPYSRPYSLPNRPDGPRRYISDEQWRRPTNEFKTENSRGAWMSERGTLSSSRPSGAPYAREGYFSSPFERPALNKVGFQPATPHTVLSGAPIPGHAVSPSLPTRPDLHAIDRWRPS